MTDIHHETLHDLGRTAEPPPGPLEFARDTVRQALAGRNDRLDIEVEIDEIDLAAAEAPARATGRRPAGREDADAYVLRLCLDLQLDSMLLTLGASAAAGSQGRTAVHSGVPWHRWLAEDLDLVTVLAADCLDGGAALPSTLGSDLDHEVPATVVDNLVARYESMRDLLLGLMASLPAPVDDEEPADEARWRPRLRTALARCESRLAELRQFRLSGTPARGIPALGSAPSRSKEPDLVAHLSVPDRDGADDVDEERAHHPHTGSLPVVDTAGLGVAGPDMDPLDVDAHALAGRAGQTSQPRRQLQTAHAGPLARRRSYLPGELLG